MEEFTPKRFRFTDRHGESRIIPGISALELDEFRELYRLFWRRMKQLDSELKIDFMTAVSKDFEIYAIALSLAKAVRIDPEWINPQMLAGLVHSYTDNEGNAHFGFLQKLYFPDPSDVLPKK